METRNVKMTLETAKRWKEMGGEYEQVAVETFPELAVKNEWVEKFENKEISGFYVAQISEIREYDDNEASISDMNLFKTEKQAKSALAYAQLTQLMALPEYNGDWVADWNNACQVKWSITRVNDELYKSIIHRSYSQIVFKSEEILDMFRKNNKDLLKQYFEL